MAKQENWTPEQFREHNAKNLGKKIQAGRLKYGNHWVEVDGIKFQSKKEAEYYGKLKLRVRIGQVTRFECQKTYTLEVNGIWVADYRADFVVYFPNGSVSVIDVKGEATEGLPVFRMKKALMKAIHGIEIQIQ